MKQAIAKLLFPLPMACDILVLGLVLLWFTRRQKAGKVLVTVGTLFLLLASNGAFADLLLGTLEFTYPPVHDPKDLGTKVRWVAVLAAGYSGEPDLPVTSRPSATSLARLLEGIRLHRLLPGSKLVVSVETHPSSVRDAAELIQALGVAKDQAVLVPGASDTHDEADLFHETIGAEPFLLVTSASHLPRAVAIFQARGMNPLPAPTHYLIRPSEMYQNWFPPSARAMERTERAVYEYLGFTWRLISR
jgi:uncharacterized SAM-binding protein YcdF (DUF218 family)